MRPNGLTQYNVSIPLHTSSLFETLFRLVIDIIITILVYSKLQYTIYIKIYFYYYSNICSESCYLRKENKVFRVFQRLKVVYKIESYT